jgi:hypothetical protein
MQQMSHFFEDYTTNGDCGLPGIRPTRDIWASSRDLRAGFVVVRMIICESPLTA